MAVGLVDVGLYGDILKGPVSAIVIENIFCPGEPARATHDRCALPHTGRPGARRGSGREIEINIIGDDQIEFAVAVVIHEGATRAPSAPLAGNARFLADVGKRTIPVVVIEHVLSVVADEQVVMAVVVVVADTRRLSPAGVP